MIFQTYVIGIKRIIRFFKVKLTFLSFSDHKGGASIAAYEILSP